MNRPLRELAVAADAPVQVFLQLHDGDEAGFVDRGKRHYGAGNKWAVAGFVGRGFIDGDGEARGFYIVLR